MSLTREWLKSRRSSSQGACVEVRLADAGVEVRDSKDPDGPILGFASDTWRTFIRGVRLGQFNTP